MADPARARRLAKRIAKIVASALEHEVKDPRLAMVTVTDAKLTADLRDATVYYTVLGDESDQVAASTALASANGVLRSTVGQQTGVRFTPTLAFVQDKVPDNAAHLDELLAKARAADAEVARLAAGAKPAGDADPYRAPREGNGQENGHVEAHLDAQVEDAGGAGSGGSDQRS